ncbi:MAG: YncE family protein, partial [Bryobacteraceae bacterium]
GKPGTDEHILHFVSMPDCKEVFSLDTGKYKRPHGIAVGERTGTIYLTSEIAQSVILVDPKEHRIIAAIPTGSPYSHMLAVTRDEKAVYVSNVHSKTVSVLNVPERKLADIVQTGSPCQRMTLSPDERWFVTNLGPAHKIAFFRTADRQLDFTVEVDGDPFIAKFSSDGKYLYNAGHKDGQARAWKVDVAQKKVIATSSDDLGRDVGSLAVNPFSGEVYVSDQATNTIGEIDPETWRVKNQLATDKAPDCMAFTTVE